MPRYDFSCNDCKERGWKGEHEVEPPFSQSGKPYACPNCGGNCTRIYSSRVEKERLYQEDGKRFSNFKEHERHLKSKGRVLTEATQSWKDIRRMAKDGQRRTQLSQKGHY